MGWTGVRPPPLALTSPAPFLERRTHNFPLCLPIPFPPFLPSFFCCQSSPFSNSPNVRYLPSPPALTLSAPFNLRSSGYEPFLCVSLLSVLLGTILWFEGSYKAGGGGALQKKKYKSWSTLHIINGTEKSCFHHKCFICENSSILNIQIYCHWF